MQKLEFIIHCSNNRSRFLTSQTARIHYLASTLRRQNGFDISISQSSTHIPVRSRIAIHWVVDSNISEIHENANQPAVAVDLQPLIPIAGMPALAIPKGNVTNHRCPDEENSPWLLSDYRCRLQDITYQPLPKRYDNILRSEKYPAVLVVKTSTHAPAFQTPIGSFIVRLGDAIGWKGDRLKHKCNSDASVLTVDQNTTPPYLIVALAARADLVISSVSSTLATAALLGTPTLPLVAKSDYLGEHVETSTDLINRGRQNSHQLRQEIISAWPLPANRETSITTFMDVILPMATRARGYPTAIENSIATVFEPPRYLSRFPQIQESTQAHNDAVASRHRLLADQFRRKLRKLQNDPLTFICDAKGTVPETICRLAKRQQRRVS